MSISVRKANLNDSKSIYSWRNNAHTRAMSLKSDVIDWDAHCRWFESTLNNAKRLLLVCESPSLVTSQNDTLNPNSSVAVVRFDIDVLSHCALISINLAPEARGQGLAKPSLKAAIEYFKAAHLDIHALHAQIKAENIASHRCFQGLGFTEKHQEDDVHEYVLALSTTVKNK